MWSAESNRMFKKTLSQTLNCEIAHCQSLVSFKRWSDELGPPFRDLAHWSILRYVEWWYGKRIYPHCLPLEEQIKNVRNHYGSNPTEGKDQGGYRWNAEGDWHH